MLDIISVDTEFGGTFRLTNTVDMIGLDCGGSQQVPNNSNENMFPQARTYAEQMTTFVGGELSSQNPFVNVDTRDLDDEGTYNLHDLFTNQML